MYMKRAGIIICALAIMLANITPVFAAEKTNLNPDAVYELTDSAGQPISLKFDYTHCSFVDFPMEGDTVKIWLDGNTAKDPDEIAVYTEKGSSKGFYKSNGSPVFYGDIGRDGRDYDYDSRTVKLRFSYTVNDSYKYYIKQDIPVEAVTPAIERMEFYTSSLTVDPEDVAVSDNDGNVNYTLLRRERFYCPDNYVVMSPFKLGESIKFYLSDGTTKTFYAENYKNANNIYWVYFVSEDGDTFMMETEEPDRGLAIGVNTVKIYIESRRDVEPIILKVYVGNKPSEQDTTVKQVVTSEFKAMNATTVSKVKTKRSGSKMTISWKKPTKNQRQAFDKIEVQYSDNKKFKNAKSKYVKKNKASCTIRKLNKKKVYYVRIRKIRKANGVTYISKWSKRKTVKR